MQYCKINLKQTNYQILQNWQYILDNTKFPILIDLYKKYCEYKQFSSVMPLFEQQVFDLNTDIIGYYHNNSLVAFSLIKRYDDKNVEALQFAWDYAEPKLRLGINSLKNECAIYKQRGFDNLFLGLADQYKQQIEGFEILGKL